MWRRRVGNNGIAEFLFHRVSLDQELVNETLDTIVKYEGDVRKAQEELKEYVRRARARRGSDAGPAGGPASDKDLLN